MCSPMLISPTTMVLDLGPCGEAELAFLQLDAIGLADGVLAHGAGIGRNLYKMVSTRI